MSDRLNEQEWVDLERCERAILAGVAVESAMIDAARALEEVHDRKLYRNNGQTWEGYCRERWNKSRRWAEQLIAWAEVMDDLGLTGQEENDTGSALPQPSIREAGRLKKIPKQKRREAWEQTTAALAGASPEEQIALLEEQQVALEEESAPLEKPPEAERQKRRILKHLHKARNPAVTRGDCDDVIALIDQALAKVEALP